MKKAQQPEWLLDPLQSYYLPRPRELPPPPPPLPLRAW
jgi:hypothetical protein